MMQLDVIMFFNIGGGEIFFVLLIVVMLFGAKRIPEIARGLGKGIKEVKNAANDIKTEITNSTTEDDSLKKFKDKIEKEKKDMEDSIGSVKRNMAYIYLIGGIVLLLFGGDFLVRASVDLALRLKVSMLVIGMTVVSFATSAPELLVSLDAAMNGYTDISFGNIVGSNIANIALILGLTAVIYPLDVQVKTYKVDWGVMMIVTLLLLTFIYFDNILTFWEAFILVVVLVLYNFLQIKKSRSEKKSSPDEAETPSKNIYITLAFLVGGVAGLKFGSDFLILGAVDLAQQWGMSERLIGLTVVSIGTSLPELAASLVAAIKGKPDLSAGNLIGSNVFNILAVLGITGMLIDLPVKSTELIDFDFPWLMGISLALFIMMRWITKGRISRGEGLFLFVAYATYILTLLIKG